MKNEEKKRYAKLLRDRAGFACQRAPPSYPALTHYASLRGEWNGRRRSFFASMKLQEAHRDVADNLAMGRSGSEGQAPMLGGGDFAEQNTTARGLP